jgi:hypothetical protein
MATFNKFNCFTQDVGKKVHDLSADVLKVMFTNVAPVATNAVKADITEIAAGGGYLAGGITPTLTSYLQTSGVAKLILQPVTFTATGAVATFRYAVLYNSTPGAGNLIGWYDYGIAATLANTETFVVSFDTTNGVFTVT